MKRFAIAFSLLTLLASGASSATIEPGEARTVGGKLTAASPSHRSVVIEMATEKGPLVVGVELKETVVPTLDGKPSTIDKLPMGAEAVLSYTREGDKLLGTKLSVKGK